MRTRYLWWVLALGLLIGLRPSGLDAQEAGATIVKRGLIAEDLYVAGRSVDVAAEVDGDVVAAGGRVTIARLVRGDVIAAGGFVSLAGEVLDDVRAAGGEVTIGDQVRGDVVAAGGSVSLTPEAAVGGAVLFVALLLGLGAFAVRAYRAYAAPGQAALRP